MKTILFTAIVISSFTETPLCGFKYKVKDVVTGDTISYIARDTTILTPGVTFRAYYDGTLEKLEIK